MGVGGGGQREGLGKGVEGRGEGGNRGEQEGGERWEKDDEKMVNFHAFAVAASPVPHLSRVYIVPRWLPHAGKGMGIGSLMSLDICISGSSLACSLVSSFRTHSGTHTPPILVL